MDSLDTVFLHIASHLSRLKTLVGSVEEKVETMKLDFFLFLFKFGRETVSVA